MRVIKSAFIILILLALSVSALQFGFQFVKEPALKGFFQLKEKPERKLFTWKAWFSSAFQDEFSSRLNDNIGLRNTLVRLNNQVDYSLFGLINAHGFIRGHEGYLYEEDYIHEYTGDYFIGKAVIDKKLARLKNVTDSLGSWHIPLLLVYEIGRAHV